MYGRFTSSAQAEMEDVTDRALHKVPSRHSLGNTGKPWKMSSGLLGAKFERSEVREITSWIRWAWFKVLLRKVSYPRSII